jgi:hypothetical protein
MTTDRAASDGATSDGAAADGTAADRAATSDWIVDANRTYGRAVTWMHTIS